MIKSNTEHLFYTDKHGYVRHFQQSEASNPWNITSGVMPGSSITASLIEEGSQVTEVIFSTLDKCFHD